MKRQDSTLRILLAALAAIALTSAAGSAAAEKKRARRGDVASSYVLDSKGNLFRHVGKHKCQVTNRVRDFKVSHHPNDQAVVYFIRNGDLYELHNAERRGSCPKTSKEKILDDVARDGRGQYRYVVIPFKDSKVVSMAQDQRGRLVAWSNRRIENEFRGIRDYSVHGRFGEPGAPYRSFVAFAIDRRGRVVKIDGKRPRTSKRDPGRYSSLREFKRSRLSAAR